MTNAGPSRSPYQNLYIYYLKGRVPLGAVTDTTTYIGNWEEEEDSFLFFTRPADRQVARIVEQYSQLTLCDQFHMTYEEWQGGALSPMRIGALRIVPAWQQDADGPTGERILLDPGVVFGTGTHPTTRDCLEAIQLAFERQSIVDAIDLGTGTGLLALAAVRLGARRCVAVDLNRLAVETALRNVRLNRMSDRILVTQGDAKNFMDLSCDLMVSNIHYDIMRYIVAAPGFKAMKQFVVSGLLRSQAKRIESQLLHTGARILQKWERDGIWFTFHGENA
jgi:ribosomal protein L11 methyltransferase